MKKGTHQSEETKEKLRIKCREIAIKNGYGKWMKGKKFSKETRKKMSENAKKQGYGKWFIGTHLSEERKKKLSIACSLALTGKKQSESHRLNNSKGHLGQIAWNKGKKLPQFTGENSNAWKGGLPICKKCSKKLSSRDVKNFLCLKCFRKEFPIKCGGWNRGLYGKNSPCWKGGRTPLEKIIRESIENNQWRKDVFKRDNYTCQECGKRSGNGEAIYLECHHKNKSFSKIFQEFLQTYSQFSPIEDKETLTRLSTTYEPFWDIDNGQTLCEDCHSLTLSYLKGN